MTREATIVLRPFGAERHANPADIAAVLELVRTTGVDVLWTHGEARTIRVSGEEDVLRQLPAALPSIVAVLGLDPRPVARPHIRPAASPAGALTAVQVADAYRFPASTGAGQRIAIIELGGGFGASDLRSYFGGLGLPVPTVNSIPVAGGKNTPDGPNGADGEVLLDIEVAGAVAPGAVLDVYFGPNTDQGFLSAVNGAIHGGADIISISWGGPEQSWDPATVTAFDQAFAQAAAAGIGVFCAAGDNGSGDGQSGENADFPASSPHVVACGGTRLTLASDGTIAAEQVWNDNPTSSASGGGYSATFGRPDWQIAVPGSKRGLPDISGNADPNSGYQVVVDGGRYVIGGTSAVAPLLAGLAARLGQLLGRRAGWLNPTAYATPTAFRDVTIGSNGAFRAGPGWDPASGLGSPDGTRLLAALQGSQPPPPVTPPPVVVPPAGGGGGALSGCFHICLSDADAATARHRAGLHLHGQAPTGEQVAAYLEGRLHAELR